MERVVIYIWGGDGRFGGTWFQRDQWALVYMEEIKSG